MGLINKRQVKAFLRRNEVRVGIEIYGDLEVQIQRMLLDAKERATKNGRNTVVGYDL